MRSFTLFSFSSLLLALFHTSVFAIPIPGQSLDLDKRAPFYMPADALDPDTLLTWIQAERSFVDPTKLVFYSGSGTWKKTKAFVKANPGYNWYSSIYNADFRSTFKIGTVSDLQAKAMSTAMAKYASGDAYVMGADLASATSVWKQQELPTLKSEGKITKLVSLTSDATSVTDTVGTLAIEDGAATIAEAATEGAMDGLLSDFIDVLFVAIL